jgi:putative ATP-binding cassette transporter
VTGPNPAAKVALFHATAGLHETGSGSILRPPLGKVAFLLEQPYLPPGTLREVLTPPAAPPVSDSAILAILEELKLDVPGLQKHDFDTPRRWDDELSLGDGQLLAVARALMSKPDFVLMDHLESALDSEELGRVRAATARHGAAAIVFSDGRTAGNGFDAVLEIAADGTWSWSENP